MASSVGEWGRKNEEARGEINGLESGDDRLAAAVSPFFLAKATKGLSRWLTTGLI
jgi:hypothetical protein